MPLVAHNDLPTFAKLRQEGLQVLSPGLANQQDIRELHIGLLNMMPDAALAATERQFLRLIGESNPIAQFFVHPFTLDALPRDASSQAHIDKYYDKFSQIKEQVLVTGDDGCVHLATSPDGFRTIFFQGHPEYDTVSLLKEYKRDVNLYINGEITEYPPMPENYISEFNAAVLREYQGRVTKSMAEQSQLPGFPEHLVLKNLQNTWQDTASAVIGTWLGLIYQVTNVDRRRPFMATVDADNPLGL